MPFAMGAVLRSVKSLFIFIGQGIFGITDIPCFPTPFINLILRRINMETIDRKFIILAVNPCNGKHYTEKNALLLCAHDKAVPVALKAYCEECERLGANPEHIQSISLLIERVKKFQEAMGGGKVPDTIGACEVTRCIDGKGV